MWIANLPIESEGQGKADPISEVMPRLISVDDLCDRFYGGGSTKE